MKRLIVVVLIVAAAAWGVSNTFAQQTRTHDQIMKDVQATFASLKKNLDASAPASVEDASKLQGLFKEVEAFWTKFNTHDAMDLAKTAQEASGNVSAKAKESDFKAALAAYANIQSTCGTCHFDHRIELQKGFQIRP